MKLEIERPDFPVLIGASPSLLSEQSKAAIRCFDAWFTENVEPINKLLREGVEVYYNYSCSDDIEAREYFWHESHVPSDEKKALLINITEIKPKTEIGEGMTDKLKKLREITDAALSTIQPESVWKDQSILLDIIAAQSESLDLIAGLYLDNYQDAEIMQAWAKQVQAKVDAIINNLNLE